MSSSRQGGTKLQNHVFDAVALSSNENYSSNGLGEVIHAYCYCDRARLATTECSNGHGDNIGPLLLCYLCENMAPFTSLHKKRLSTESSPLDPLSARNRVSMGTRARTYANGHALQAKGGLSGVESY
jgi:hypothetical protein